MQPIDLRGLTGMSVAILFRQGKRDDPLHHVRQELGSSEVGTCGQRQRPVRRQTAVGRRMRRTVPSTKRVGREVRSGRVGPCCNETAGHHRRRGHHRGIGTAHAASCVRGHDPPLSSEQSKMANLAQMQRSVSDWPGSHAPGGSALSSAVAEEVPPQLRTAAQQHRYRRAPRVEPDRFGGVPLVVAENVPPCRGPRRLPIPWEQGTSPDPAASCLLTALQHRFSNALTTAITRETAQ